VWLASSFTCTWPVTQRIHPCAVCCVVQVRGHIVLERYHKAEKACVDADNWFDTGDVASIDRFGVMKIQDRCAQGSARACSS
jgi:acyl-CoA synthetase (AMP-forming)/AMP-acid ligase II